MVEKEPTPTRDSSSRLIPIIVLTAVLSSLFTALLMSLLGSRAQPLADTLLSSSPFSEEARSRNQVMDPEDLAILFDRISPSVVRVSVITEGGGGSGSGFVIQEGGLMLTNNHVVENAESVSVILKDVTDSFLRVIRCSNMWRLDDRFNASTRDLRTAQRRGVSRHCDESRCATRSV